MVSKVKGGYVVRSESGRRLSRVYPTKTQAQQRLAQIEWFKNKK